MYWKGMKPSGLLEYESRLAALIQKLPSQEVEPLSRITKEGEGIPSTFGLWVCATNSLPDFNNSLANRKKLKGFALKSSGDISNLANDFDRFKLSNLIESHASHIRASSRPSISPDDLIAGIDQVDNNIASCIKLAEAVLYQPD
jgi:hypothetical protein